MAYTLQKLMVKKCSLLERNFGKNLEMQCYLIAIKRIASYITALLIPLDFRVHSFISLTVFAYTATKKKKVRTMSCVSDVLYSIVLCIGLTVLVLKVTSAGHAKALPISYHQHILPV